MTTEIKTDLQYKQDVYDGLIEHQDEPIDFFTRCLDVKEEFIWPKMVEVAESVRDNQFTAVPAAHSVSKTFTAARIAVWFKSCFQPSTVITTAPSDNQVKNQLWREIHAAYAGAKTPLGGKMTTLVWDVKPSQYILDGLEPDQKADWEKNFAIGFSTSPDQAAEHATKMQGWHNKWLLVILDEACGLLPQIWRTVMDSLIINERCKVLAIGNLTDPLAEFAQVCEGKDPKWNIIRISTKHTPNYIKGREVIPGLSGRDYEERIRTRYGIDSNSYKIRVLGEAPEYREGTFYGKELAEAKKQHRIGSFPQDPAAKVYQFIDLGDMYTAAIDVQFLEGRIRVTDCYWDNTGQGIPGLAKSDDTKQCIYGGHWCGPDLATSNKKAGASGMMTKDIATQLGIKLTPVIPHSFNDGIEAVRSIWPLLEIDKILCEVFIQACKGYRKKKNESLSTDNQPVYHNTPLQSWERHMMDALRHLAIAFRYMKIEEKFIGWKAPADKYPHRPRGKRYDSQPLDIRSL